MKLSALQKVPHKLSEQEVDDWLRLFGEDTIGFNFTSIRDKEFRHKIEMLRFARIACSG
jgi:hypothetical protein